MPEAPPDQSPLPLRAGDSGKAVLDLQQRLADLGFGVEDAPGEFGPSTASGLARFQLERGLAGDGVCDRTTWSAVVEAGYRLGDRLIYRTRPMMRGDDVAELQRRLSTLGFDPGRIDGIFGDDSSGALMDFQRNAGVAVDGICGARTVEEITRLQLRDGPADFVSTVRERIRVAGGRVGSLDGRRIAVGESGGFGAGVQALCRSLREAGAFALPLHHPDPSSQAAQANAAGVDCVITLVLEPDERVCRSAFYRGYAYESAASRNLASLIQASLPRALGIGDGGTAGMALPILRETRMPSVEIRLGAPEVVVQRTSELARVVVSALVTWIDADWD